MKNIIKGLSIIAIGILGSILTSDGAPIIILIPMGFCLIAEGIKNGNAYDR